MRWRNQTQLYYARSCSTTKRGRQSARNKKMTSSKTRTGRAGEHFVAYLIERSGLEAARVDGACDLHVTLDSGRVLRVEVKTATKLAGHKYKFYHSSFEADIFALVAIQNDQPLVRFLEESNMPRYSLHRDEFTQENQDADLQWIASLD